MDLGLSGKVAIVAAASKGLGLAVARSLAAGGASVAICARSADSLKTAAASIGGDVLTAPLNVTDADAVNAFVESVRARFGRVDICVTNAGGPPSKTFEQTTTADWESAVQLNLMSTLHFAHAVLP